MDLFRVICSVMVSVIRSGIVVGLYWSSVFFSLTIRFIVYDVSQIRTQYLLEMDIKYK